eukprot:scaffold304_cov80-Skeletonema_menzelii.AAC.3
MPLSLCTSQTSKAGDNNTTTQINTISNSLDVRCAPDYESRHYYNLVIEKLIDNIGSLDQHDAF